MSCMKDFVPDCMQTERDFELASNVAKLLKLDRGFDHSAIVYAIATARHEGFEAGVASCENEPVPFVSTKIEYNALLHKMNEFRYDVTGVGVAEQYLAARMLSRSPFDKSAVTAVSAPCDVEPKDDAPTHNPFDPQNWGV